jgi:hypothetical protein
MSIQPRPWIAVLFLFIFGAVGPLRTCHADPSDDDDENGTKKNYYWQGTQLNNLSRLGSSSDFEEEQRRANAGKDGEQYLSTIREQMAHQAQRDAQKKATLAFDGQLSANAIEVAYLSPGVRVTLHAEALFDENSSSMKLGAMDTLERLNTVLGSVGQQPLQLVIADKMDDMPESKDLDAERSRVVLSMLEMSQKDTDRENLTPEILTR